MKKMTYLMILLMFVSLEVLPANAKVNKSETMLFIQTNVCTVADPTGTPLNVRSSPVNGTIVAKLKNGTVVRVENYNDEAGDETANWWQISVTKNGKRRTLGWVTSKFLNCN
jgi:hypothetical protein